MDHPGGNADEDSFYPIIDDQSTENGSLRHKASAKVCCAFLFAAGIFFFDRARRERK